MKIPIRFLLSRLFFKVGDCFIVVGVRINLLSRKIHSLAEKIRRIE